ncbi:hypothetical protein ACIQZO_40295 [Streptomyces sp. NPDC097617]|uniref:hypothetical protein n=1 Tax=Streptomyces sp. NPDC097617 TaxID=3366091 RepID=UPI0037F93A5B
MAFLLEHGVFVRWPAAEWEADLLGCVGAALEEAAGPAAALVKDLAETRTFGSALEPPGCQGRFDTPQAGL